MESVTTEVLLTFFQRFGEQITMPVTIYLFGGSALCLLGSPRETLDVDYSIESSAPEIEKTLERLAQELKLDLELVPLEEFIPLPDDFETRHQFVGRYGNLDVYIFDLYSIALSKIARGFESDLEDVEFLINQKLIAWEVLTKHYQTILPRARDADIDPREFQQYFETLSRKINR
jgi:hypothetical protein